MCTADCNPPCKLQWVQSGETDTIIQKSAKLDLGIAERYKDGIYRCLATGTSSVSQNLREKQSADVRIDVQCKYVI